MAFPPAFHLFGKKINYCELFQLKLKGDHSSYFGSRGRGSISQASVLKDSHNKIINEQQEQREKEGRKEGQGKR